MKRRLAALAVVAALANYAGPASAAEYDIDTKGAHASINFKIKHLGYSWLLGRFDTFTGTFFYDETKPDASKISVEIDTKSVNSNHAERDKHLRSADFLNVDKHPKATFVSKSIKPAGDGKATVTGDFTLNGVTKEVAINATYIGGGDDPWGGFRQGFQGTTELKLADFGITKDLGPASANVLIDLHVEGVRK
jgi:polyisoprenoid-binding protein YceI